jgi:hypothetical protein
MSRNVDAQFAHCGDSLGADAARLGTRAEYLEAASGVVVEQAFDHLASG